MPVNGHYRFAEGGVEDNVGDFSADTQNFRILVEILEVFMLINLMEETERLPIAGKIIWKTPVGAEGYRASPPEIK